MIEVMVATMLLAIVAVAILPMLITGLKNASRNATLATATGLVNQQLEDARSRTTCSALGRSPFSVTDTRGATLNVARTVSTCPTSGYPQAIPVSIAVTSANGVQVSFASTLVYVEAP